MKPDRSNYEIWLIDWVDGNLNKVQIEQLMAFLEKNSDIKEEAEILASSYLKPEKQSFLQKENLKKNIADLTSSQLDYLSVAYLENDLSSDQLAELKHNLDQNREGKRAFEIIQRLKLVPVYSEYRNKNKLKRLTVGEKVIRLSVAGLSAAATIALLIASIIFIPRYLTDKSELLTNTITDSLNIQTSVPVFIPSKILAESLVFEKAYAEPVFSKDNILINNETADELVASVVSDSSDLRSEEAGYIISKIPLLSQVELESEMPDHSLIASNFTFRASLADDERSRFKKLIARVFRDKLLNEENTSDAPLKPYEIAKAGIDGLNKLLGWEMALKETNDEAGDLKSVSFNSRILKFNAPVKKVESSQ